MAEFLWRRPFLYPKQSDAIFNDAVIATIEAASGSGKTYGCLVWLIEQAVGKRGTYWWLSPSRAQYRAVLKLLEEHVPKQVGNLNQTTSIYKLFNGSYIEFKTGDDPDLLYGEVVEGAVVDEASRLKEESWYALRSTLAKRDGPVRCIGNVVGRRNWFYRLCRRAEKWMEENPNPERRIYHYGVIDANDAIKAGVISQDAIDLQRENFPEAEFRALYFNEPPADGGNPFSFDAITACTVDPLTYDPVVCSSDPPVCYGIDLGSRQSWTVIIGLDEDGYVCKFHRFKGDWAEQERKIVNLVGNKVPALIDSTGVGSPIRDFIEDRGLKNFQDYPFTEKSRQQLLERLAMAIQGREVFFPPGQITKELEEFTYEEKNGKLKYVSPGHIPDDTTMALGLSVIMKGDALRRKPRPLVLAGTGGSRSGPHSLGGGGKESPWF